MELDKKLNSLTPQGIKRKIDILMEEFTMLGYSDPLVFLEQFSYFMFIKLLNEIYRKESEYPDAITSALIESNMENIDWALLKRLKGNEMVFYLKQNSFPFINDIGRTLNPGLNFMEHASLVMDKYDILMGIMETIDAIFLLKKQNSENDSEISGEIIEYLLGMSFNSQKHGEFFTPRHLVNIIVEMISPEPSQRIFDPSCGSAGFLVAACKYIDNEYGRGNEISIEGYDINSRILNIAKINLFFHSIYGAELKNCDALRDDQSSNLKYDIILANPPVGGNVSSYENYSRLQTRTRNLNLLFIQTVMNKLDTNGKSALLVPEGFLFRGGVDYIAIRERLLCEFKIEGIVSLPHGVFMPYTNAKASIVLFTRTEMHLSRPSSDKIWFYELTADGYSLDRKRISVKENDIPDLLQKWKAKEEHWIEWIRIIESGRTVPNESGIPTPVGWDKKNIWFGDYESIKSKGFNLSASIYKPSTSGKIIYDSPMELLTEILDIEEEVTEKLRNLIKETEIYG